MKSNSYRVILVSLLMIFSSLAGCLAGDEEPLPGEVESLGTVMVSTYHVGELVKAVAGDQVTLEYMSQANIPVHDYEPSAEDLIRLQSADIFFYHGLGLEPWVDSTLEGLGGNAPTSIETHRMPSGEDTLDYEGMLVTELCELLTVGPYESTTLAMDEDDASEIHAEYVAHTLSFPEMDDDHDDHGDDDHDDHGDDDHDDHGDDDHDDHDDHDEHDHSEYGHATPEETIENPTDCPADTVISIFHMEEGEYTLEFEEAEDLHEFNMAVLKMGGGHAHHDHHGHGDDHGDEDRDRDDHDEHDDHGDEDRDHDDHEDDLTAEQVLERFDANNDSHLSWDEFVGMMESMDDDHDDHGDDDHDDHGDDDHDDHGDDHDDHDDHDPIEEAMEEYMMDMLMSMFNESDADNDTLLSVDELENFIESMDHLEDDLDSAVTEIMISAFDEDEDGLLSMSEFVSMMEAMDDDHDDHGDHDDHWDPNTCHDSETHETHDEYTNEEDCEAAGYMWMGDEEHDDHGDDDYNETEMMELMFHMFDTNGDESIDASELDMLMEMGEDEHAGHVTIHIEAEGEYGFALPHDVEFYVLMGEDGHDDHDDHDDHGDDEMVCYDMSTHTVDATIDNEADCDAAGLMWTAANSGPGGDDDHGDEDDHGGHDDHGDEEVLNFDPHSWLDPMAFNAQLVVVMESLITAFPSAEADFRSNGDAYAAQLRDLDDAFDAAFGEGGVCMAGGHEKTVAANHNAYSYIAVRYDIQFVTVHGLDPEGEPSPEDVAEVVEHMTEEGINVLFVEEYTGQTAVQSIVEETGATVQILYTMEMAPSDSDDDYMSMMNKNLDNLVAGMGC
jgi:ABC-type Zn uptake system ZnuABC Zn-binding protein ZnuA/Ca2+-binding EF-hand superfamily protein